jgi:dUTP pyrophosphatase
MSGWFGDCLRLTCPLVNRELTPTPEQNGVGSWTVEVLIRRLDPDLPPPRYAHPGDAGADLVSRVDVVLGPGERHTVPTGVALALPDGYAGFVHPRSGLAARHGVTIVNAPGTVDAGYRGEINITLLNTDRTEPFTVHRGDRIAQLVLQRVERARFVEVTRLPGSVRGDGGFGSTGGFGVEDQGAPARLPRPGTPANVVGQEEAR